LISTISFNKTVKQIWCCNCSCTYFFSTAIWT